MAAAHADSITREKVDFPLNSAENDPNEEYSTEAENLVRRIAVAAHEAEDIIEVEAADRIRAASTQRSPSFLADLQKVLEDLDSIKEKVIKLKEETGLIINHFMLSPSSSSPPPLAAAASKTTNMVGFEGYVAQLLDHLIGDQSAGRGIIPIVGMGGIGKTTLATKVYENSNIMRHFNVRVWVTVSQKFSARKIYLQALSCLGRSINDSDAYDDQQLSHELYKILYNRRYLIVLDDVWSIDAWDKIQFFFPENNNRSRIVVTTRESKLVAYFGSSALALDFLDEKSSWELFCAKTFCPPELEQVGKKIVDKCKGLPLAIVVIGGLLGKSPRMQEYWEKIANDRSLIIDSEEGKETSSILNLSYKHLPVWMKSCFLYVGLFPEDHRILVADLIKLWVAEGFIKPPNTDQTFEAVAMSYLEELVDRNILLLVRDSRQKKKLKSCGVHDLVRDMCVRIAEKESFYCVERNIDGKGHYIVDERTERSARVYCGVSRTWKRPSIVLPFVLEGQRLRQCKSRLLRVLVHNQGPPVNLYRAFRQVNLRFLSHGNRVFSLHQSTIESLPSAISLLWSLQTLIVLDTSLYVAPPEIWKMPQLRHIEIPGFILPDPPHEDDDGVLVLQNLQTLMLVKNLNLSEDICKRITNIKELHIEYGSSKGPWESLSSYHLDNVGCFNKLEVLSLRCTGYEDTGGDAFQNLKLPSSLKELRLCHCKLKWSDMRMIASLPRLQILMLWGVLGHEWRCDEEQFLSLKELSISNCDDLVCWIADSSNFPVLETLSLGKLSKLEEIPSGIGYIPTLAKMSVYKCSESACISAVEMQQENEMFGNMGLEVRLNFWGDKTKANMLREKIQEVGFTSQNLLINGIQIHEWKSQLLSQWE